MIMDNNILWKFFYFVFILIVSDILSRILSMDVNNRNQENRLRHHFPYPHMQEEYQAPHF